MTFSETPPAVSKPPVSCPDGEKQLASETPGAVDELMRTFFSKVSIDFRKQPVKRLTGFLSPQANLVALNKPLG
jgi:hypothetical protein